MRLQSNAINATFVLAEGLSHGFNGTMSKDAISASNFTANMSTISCEIGEDIMEGRLPE